MARSMARSCMSEPPGDHKVPPDVRPKPQHLAAAIGDRVRGQSELALNRPDSVGDRFLLRETLE